jgi:hypothetical protein
LCLIIGGADGFFVLDGVYDHGSGCDVKHFHDGIVQWVVGGK